MGCRFNLFFADKYDANVNSIDAIEVAWSARMRRVVQAKIEQCIDRDEERERLETEACPGETWDPEDYVFEGYTGDIASSTGEFFASATSLVIGAEHEENLGAREDYFDQEWFEPVAAEVNEKCQKWGPSMCMRINGRWAVMGLYAC